MAYAGDFLMARMKIRTISAYIYLIVDSGKKDSGAQCHRSILLKNAICLVLIYRLELFFCLISNRRTYYIVKLVENRSRHVGDDQIRWPKIYSDSKTLSLVL